MNQRDPLREVEMLAASYLAATERVEMTRSLLYAQIRIARTLGYSWGDLARATGLSRERVRQIVG